MSYWGEVRINYPATRARDRARARWRREKSRSRPRKSERPPQDVRAVCELTTEPTQWTPIGINGHGISYYDKDNAGRDKWNVHDAQRAVVTRIWGRGAAEAACRQLAETGQITR